MKPPEWNITIPSNTPLYASPLLFTTKKDASFKTNLIALKQNTDSDMLSAKALEVASLCQKKGLRKNI
jgi:hypothetical protein